MIEIYNVSVDENAIQKELSFYIKYSYQEYVEIPISFDGMVLTQDGKRVGYLNEVPVKQHKSQFTGGFLSEQAILDYAIEQERQVILNCCLSEPVISYLEDIRLKNAKKDLTLEVVFRKKYFETDNSFAELIQYFISKKSTDRLYQRQLLEHFRIQEQTFSATITISASDWLYDYAPKLGLGNFLLVEFPQPQFESPHNVFEERLDNMKGFLKEMKQKLNSGEWKEVMISFRQFTEQLQMGALEKENTLGAKLKTAYKARNGTDIGFNEMYQAVNNLFDFASKFIHTRSKNKEIQPQPAAHKEDAYFVYSLAVNFTNLYLSKLKDFEV